jgi:hypothetical protein
LEISFSYRFFVDKFDVNRDVSSNEEDRRIFGRRGFVGTGSSFDSSSENNFFTLTLRVTDGGSRRGVD